MKKKESEMDAKIGKKSIAEESLAGASPPKESEAEETKTRFDELSEAHDALKDELLRARADCDNLYKRMQRELIRMQNQGIRSFAFELCEVMDQLHLAQDKLHSSRENTVVANELVAGINMVYNELLKAFHKHGITPIKTVGKRFNPETCEAVGTVKTDQVASGYVAQEVRKGYTLNDTLLRAAKVLVAAKPEETKADSGE